MSARDIPQEATQRLPVDAAGERTDDPVPPRQLPANQASDGAFGFGRRRSGADPAQGPGPSERRVAIHPRTLLLIRWVAVVGQIVAVLSVHDALGYPIALIECLATIGALAIANIWLWVSAPPGPGRISEARAARIMAFDLVQLGVLIAFTGGLANPFSVLILGPVTVAATILRARTAAVIIALSAAIATGLAFFHYPLPWLDTQATGLLVLPQIYLLGLWTAIMVALVFIGSYVWTVSDDGRRLSAALGESEAALAKEREMSALGALAAAAAHELGSPLATIAVVTKDLKKEVHPDDPLRDDILLLHEQSERCRDILVGLEHRPADPLASDGVVVDPYERLSLSALVDAAAENHVPAGIRLEIKEAGAVDGPMPQVLRRPEILHGLGNLIANAGQFARAQVSIRLNWDAKNASILVRDDGPGFAPHILQTLGDPYISTRAGRQGHLGLGVFIATTLLESIGGRLAFRNQNGAEVRITLPRAQLESRAPRPK